MSADGIDDSSSSNGKTSLSSNSLGFVIPDFEFDEVSDIGVFQIFKNLFVVITDGV